MSVRNGSNYLEWVDNTKGVAIVFVILYHCHFFCGKEYFQWFHQVVPLFLFCTSYCYGVKANPTFFSTKRISVMLQRVFYPFVVIEVITIFILFGIIIYNKESNPYSINRLLKYAGLGSGSYFPIVYIQCWIVIPFVLWLKHKYAFTASFVIYFIICITLEWLFFELFGDNKWLWRLVCIRYLMILYVGVNYDDFRLRKTLSSFFILISIFLAVIDIYYCTFHNVGWDGTYCFTSFYILLLIPLFMHINIRWLALVGKWSYDIFLIQLLYTAVWNYMIETGKLYFSFISDVISLFFISIIAGIYILFKEKNIGVR